ncbi:putative major facilitator superfamily transporter [Colletotrichum sublineola]|uniref:Putative major facilitator superfamily transporter n=1 Tax=Colletotrichum sublineola TaxID=1173701 RepID=A0A066XMV9_COLSU|nr:putative major facilitator superfamily transporter [Colletotrichum sublineola]
MSVEKSSVGEKVRGKSVLNKNACTVIWLRVSNQERLVVFFLGDEAKSQEEKRLVRKIDRAAFANAYVAGLREALHMTGHDYNTVLSVTTAGVLTFAPDGER